MDEKLAILRGSFTFSSKGVTAAPSFPVEGLVCSPSKGWGRVRKFVGHDTDFSSPILSAKAVAAEIGEEALGSFWERILGRRKRPNVVRQGGEKGRPRVLRFVRARLPLGEMRRRRPRPVLWGDLNSPSKGWGRLPAVLVILSHFFPNRRPFLQEGSG